MVTQRLEQPIKFYKIKKPPIKEALDILNQCFKDCS
ncbi:hypothetical protein Phi87_32 [Enterobacteria phage UAB_Phi87]|uniref:Uncharacterized protein n=1 Tax=Enterobacteria phage UAB_Phi87 TaxID=1197935 RepID=M1FGM3_9CAUD|nr:hypothetical protein Phi87_32 [Enterobacteria phage UAB_Phi87]AFQ96073.1 hypothetical protein Phi87_32 [Enterobacteria phage UAB_Phi87]